ncbi:uncharacterized protein LOC131626697 [Vicia villosa]|uniref:uncharacterized protein LOC131626697 n=1 Tax=Vicia villosa TaxID=3911 RepID=UPI00273C1FD5|nr:uncharacterized protein LOC131626697 [Vicia villosa]
MISPSIQKDIVKAASLETTKAILTDLGDELFAILVDESRDVSNKEQMAVALRYVNKNVIIIESFLGIVHVKSTTTIALKVVVEELFCKHGLTTSRIRGQGYDGADNMQGEFSGLKSLILSENPSAFYVHCFTHQLQLTLVVIAKDHLQVCGVFNLVSTLINVVGGSCKRQDMLRERQIENIREALGKGEIASGQGLNQEANMKRAADTRWSYYFATLTNLILMYDSILGISNELSQALQRKDQDIVNAMKLVDITKQRLQALRDDGWKYLVDEVTLFCNMHDIHIPNMDDIYFPGRSRRGSNVESITIEKTLSY